MNEEEIVTALREQKQQRTAVELAELLDQLTSGGLSQSTLVTYFKRAFPSLPLHILLESGAWSRVSDGGLSDEEFNRLLRPWLGK
ncbi:hypothetical protein [Hyalangium versicolor]|uniref:hypothetical protein n=1 Tax=Hyalangium versicolor TaxID=2861190 RepID=UPI001CCA6F46|nr:hypothetical protein [Hyalangium versicolor]